MATDKARLLFRKRNERGTVLCELFVYDDMSVYVCGDGIEVIFEESPDALTRAVRHVESLGYERELPDDG